MIINSQLGGKKPTGTKSITANGTHNVADYEYADVQVPTTAPSCYKEYTVDANGKLRVAPSIMNLSGATDVSDYALLNAYQQVQFPSNTIADLSSLTAISGQYACQSMFQQSRNIVSVNLSGLITISGYAACLSMFSGTHSLTTVNLSSLTTISSTNNGCNNMFNGCSGLISADLSSLTTISGTSGCEGMFSSCGALTSINLNSLTTVSASSAFNRFAASCSSLTSAKFNALSTISQPLASSATSSVFYECRKLESVEFGGLTASTFANKQNQLQYLFSANTGTTAPNGCTVHFPSNFDPDNPDKTFDITILTGYPTFGGNALYIHVAFDLAATE